MLGQRHKRLVCNARLCGCFVIYVRGINYYRPAIRSKLNKVVEFLKMYYTFYKHEFSTHFPFSFSCPKDK